MSDGTSNATRIARDVVVLSMSILLLAQTCVAAPTSRSPATQPAGRPGLRCVLVVPPGVEPFADAQQRLNLVLKDVQWWYSCQMEAHGYGPKTFSLETDESGNVVVHVARLEKPPPSDPKAVNGVCIIAAEKVLGTPRERRGTIMVVVYNGYIWKDRSKHICIPHGRGARGRWAFFTAWHYNNICPKAWRIHAWAGRFRDRKGLLDPLHLKVLAAMTNERESIGKMTSAGYGGFAHEIGHAFYLHHPTKDNPNVKGNVMWSGLAGMRGNFLRHIRNEWSTLTPHDAGVLNENPLFQPREVGPPSTGVSRKVGMRGAKQARAATRAHRRKALGHGRNAGS